MPNISESIRLNSTAPNFERDRIDTLYELRNARLKAYDVGHIVYCVEDGQHYKFMGDGGRFGVALDDITGYFRVLIPKGSGEGGNCNCEDNLYSLQRQIDDNTASVKEHTELIGRTSNTVAEHEEKIDIIYNELFPYSVSLHANTLSGESISSINLKGTVLDAVLSFSILQNDAPVDPSIIDKLEVIVNGVSNSINIDSTVYPLDSIQSNTSIKVVYTFKDGIKKDASLYINFYPYSYFGILESNEEFNHELLEPILLGSRYYTTSVTQDYQKNCFAYPASFGNLVSIKDAKNYELLTSYTKTTTKIGEDEYFVYTLTYPSTVENYKLIFS